MRLENHKEIIRKAQREVSPPPPSRVIISRRNERAKLAQLPMPVPFVSRSSSGRSRPVACGHSALEIVWNPRKRRK